jgi:hypothetical protein
VTVATLALCGLVPASASAAASFTQAWGWGVLDGQSQFESCTSSCQAGISGGGGGQLANPFGVAIDSAGNVYVADYNNNRVSSFSSSGAFLETWGWGVSDGLSQFETCTSSCQSGVAGNGAGQFHEPIGIAVDASGDVYVTDYYNNRVEEFTSSGGYIGQFGTAYGPEGISTDSSGNIYVALSGQHRIDKYTATGSFIETWGWGVNDGQNQFETCTARLCHLYLRPGAPRRRRGADEKSVQRGDGLRGQRVRRRPRQ